MQPLWSAPPQPPLSVPASLAASRCPGGAEPPSSSDRQPPPCPAPSRAQTQGTAPHLAPSCSSSAPGMRLAELPPRRGPGGSRRRGRERAPGAGQGEPLAAGSGEERTRGVPGPARRLSGEAGRGDARVCPPPQPAPRLRAPPSAHPPPPPPALRLSHSGSPFPPPVCSSAVGPFPSARGPGSRLNCPPRPGAAARARDSCLRSGGPTGPCPFPGLRAAVPRPPAEPSASRPGKPGPATGRRRAGAPAPRPVPGDRAPGSARRAPPWKLSSYPHVGVLNPT